MTMNILHIVHKAPSIFIFLLGGCLVSLEACGIASLQLSQIIDDVSPFFKKVGMVINETDQHRVSEIVKLVKTFARQRVAFETYLVNYFDLDNDIDRSIVMFACPASARSLKALLKTIGSSRLGVANPFLIFVNKTEMASCFQDSFKSLAIDQEIYLIDKASFEIHEVYSVNGIVLETVLTQRAIRDTNIEQRRNDFMGQYMTIMTDADPPSIFLDKDLLNKSVFHLENQTYDVTSLVEGLYHKYLLDLSTRMNFTYRLFRRKDGMWGTVKDNKTYGMLNDLSEGNADLIASSFTLMAARFAVIDYLPVMTIDKNAIFISNDWAEDISWTAYLNPLAKDLWIMILIEAAIFAIWLHYLHYHYNPSKSDVVSHHDKCLNKKCK